MEKCVQILMQYLKNKPNSLLQLLMQFNKLSVTNTHTHLKPHQINRLKEEIMANFITSASNYTQQLKLNRNAIKKTFIDFAINVYKLYRELILESLKSTYLREYSNLMIECYRLSCADADMLEDATFQQAHDYYANEMRQSKKKDKTAKKPTINVNKTDIQRSTTNKVKKANNQSNENQPISTKQI